MAIFQNINAVQRMKSLIHYMESLLSKKGSPCVACGGNDYGDKPLSVCNRCWETIPWIQKVQCPRCGRYEECTDCTRRIETHFVQNRSAVRYDDLMKDWLALYKYRGKETLRQVLGQMLLHAYHLHRQHAMSGADKVAMKEFITYVPLSEERYDERGFNQAEQLAVELGKHLEIPVIPLLKRTIHTDKQSLKVREQRLGDLQGVFAVNERLITPLISLCREERVRIFMVDDVYTTGSTLNECARTIKTAIPAEIYGISWAR